MYITDDVIRRNSPLYFCISSLTIVIPHILMSSAPSVPPHSIFSIKRKCLFTILHLNCENDLYTGHKSGLSKVFQLTAWECTSITFTVFHSGVPLKLGYQLNWGTKAKLWALRNQTANNKINSWKYTRYWGVNCLSNFLFSECTEAHLFFLLSFHVTALITENSCFRDIPLKRCGTFLHLKTLLCRTDQKTEQFWRSISFKIQSFNCIAFD